MKLLEINKNLVYIILIIGTICLTLTAMIYGILKIKNLQPNNGLINVEGSAYVSATPNIALINMTIRAEAPKTSDAQVIVKAKAQNVLKALGDLKIAAADIKTENYATYPKYDYPPTPICTTSPCPPRPKPILTGYEVSQTIIAKLRDIDNVGAILETLGKLEISQFSGPNFALEDVSKAKSEARSQAIKNAQASAKLLAQELGVKLLSIKSFSEQSTPYQPQYLLRGANLANNSEITPGENKITSNVAITYEVE
jgi:uncharacterized protein YggE